MCDSRNDRGGSSRYGGREGDYDDGRRGPGRWDALEDDRREDSRGGGGRWGRPAGGRGEERAGNDGRWGRMREDESVDWSKPLARSERIEQ